MMKVRRSVMGVITAGLLLLPAAAQPAFAQDEAVKVHGEWVIEVRNADGSLSARHEFQNALQFTGTERLVDLLLKRIALRGFSVALNTSSGALRLGQPGNALAGSGTMLASSVNLEAKIFTPNLAPNRLELSGTVSAPSATNGQWDVQSVATYLHYDWLSGPNAGRVDVFDLFTSKALPTPITVSAGQIVQVRVRIAFS